MRDAPHSLFSPFSPNLGRRKKNYEHLGLLVMNLTFGRKLNAFVELVKPKAAYIKI